MATVTYHVVVTFDRNADGELVPGEASELGSVGAAKRSAGALAAFHAGAVAFSRTSDPATGRFGDAVVLVSVGEVDWEAPGLGL